VPPQCVGMRGVSGAWEGLRGRGLERAGRSRGGQVRRPEREKCACAARCGSGEWGGGRGGGGGGWEGGGGKGGEGGGVGRREMGIKRSARCLVREMRRDVEGARGGRCSWRDRGWCQSGWRRGARMATGGVWRRAEPGSGSRQVLSRHVGRRSVVGNGWWRWNGGRSDGVAREGFGGWSLEGRGIPRRGWE